MPSLTLLGQSVVSGLLAGGLYGLLALGLSLSWGLLRLVNLGHFALAFLGAYLTYQLGTVAGTSPPWVAVLAHRAAVLRARRRAARRLRLLPRRPSSPRCWSPSASPSSSSRSSSGSGRRTSAATRRRTRALSSGIGPLFVPTLELLACLTAAALALATWAWLRFTYVGKALRASAEDPAMAAAFGVNHRAQAFFLSGVSAAYAAVAGGLHRPDLHAGAVADLGLARRGLRRGDHRRPRQPDRRAARRPAHRRQRIGHHGGGDAGLGAAGVVLRPDRSPGRCGPGARERAASPGGRRPRWRRASR